MNDWLVQAGSMWLAADSILPHVNATLNLTATVLIVAGWLLVRSGRERAHRNVMLAAFVVSSVFLVTYLLHKAMYGDTPFPRAEYPAWAVPYYVLLASHVLLALTVPFLVIAAIVFGLRDRRAAHRRVVRFAFPIWLYVSVTGVLVYLFLYWWFVPAGGGGSG